MHTHSKGFTLIETLVAISILVVAVAGAMTAAQNGISSSIFSKDQVIAFYLAEEGTEMIRNLRDKNGLDGTYWLTGIADTGGDPCYFGTKCKVDAITGALTTCGSSCPVLKQDPTNGFYGYNAGWTDTIFQREISLTQINANEVAILVEVKWSKGLTQRSFKVHENILNWQ